MKRLGFKKRKKKIHPHNQCSICSEDDKLATSGRAREKEKIQKEIQQSMRA